MVVKYKNPYKKVVLSWTVEEIEKAVRRVFELAGTTEDIELALEVCWSIASTLSKDDQKKLSLVQTIITATLDGLIEPPEFDIYAFAQEVAETL